MGKIESISKGELKWLLNEVMRLAANNGSRASVKKFLKRGADINSKNVSGETALHIATVNDNVAIARLLLQNGADPNAGNQNNDTPLHLTESSGMARLLISHGSDVTKRDNYGDTPLHAAAANGRKLEVAKVLIGKGVEINKRNNYGNTALHWVVRNNDTKLVKLLLESGADPSIKNRYGVSPLMEAKAYGFLSILRLLQKYSNR